MYISAVGGAQKTLCPLQRGKASKRVILDMTRNWV